MKKEYLLFIIIILLIIAISGILLYAISNNKTIQTSSNNTKSSNKIQNTLATNKATNNTVKENTVGIVSHKIDKYGIIEVIIRNNTSNTLKTLQIKAYCWDKEGNNLGDYNAYKSNIVQNENYKIQIYSSTDTAKYKLELKYE